jgi:thiosulfate dehydrogenase [quinone] large subunit
MDMITTPTNVTEITAAQPTTTTAEPTVARYVWALTRLCLSWTFLWPFLDKTFGLGHETTAAHAWIHGGSPSFGFLSGAVGPFAGIYQSIAGAGWVNWMFMIGLLGIAVALLLGIGMRIAAISGAVLLVRMWSASLPPRMTCSWTITSSTRLFSSGSPSLVRETPLGLVVGGRRRALSDASPGSPE